jgi:hypothetical protein
MLINDFKAFITLLNQHKVQYLIIGGYAVALHGHPRYTKDLDVWVRATPENITYLIAALIAFGFEETGLQVDDFLLPETIIQLGFPPNRIVILNTPKSIDFESCCNKRIEVTIDDVKLNVIDLTSLRKNKSATGRYQDLADLENLPESTENP